MSQLIVYRLSTAERAGDLSGEGSRLYGGRWNERGTPAIYCAESISLALLEMLVHVGDSQDLPTDYTVTEIEVTAPIKETVESGSISRELSQQLGTSLLEDTGVLGFWVPSVVVPQERNLVLNPRAQEFAAGVKVLRTFVLDIDQRLGR